MNLLDIVIGGIIEALIILGLIVCVVYAGALLDKDWTIWFKDILPSAWVGGKHDEFGYWLLR